MTINSFKILSYGEKKSTKEIELNPGIYNIYGDNGSGKSSILRGIERHLLKKEEGEILVYNNRMNFPLHLSERRIIDLLSSYSIDLDFSKYQPTYHNKPLYEYSTGECKIALIKILVALKPDYLLIDEPFSELSDENSAYILNLICTLTDTVIVITSHNKLCVDEVNNIFIEEIYDK